MRGGAVSEAQWLCYRPRVFERGGRNYQVETCGQSFPGRFLDAFTAEAEDMWRATQGQPAVTAWRYASLGSSSSMVLCRCAPEQQGEARAPVVWALLVPYAAVRGARFELAGLAPFFPAVTPVGRPNGETGSQLNKGGNTAAHKGKAAKGVPKASLKVAPLVAKEAQVSATHGVPQWPGPPDWSALSAPQRQGPDVSGLISRYLELGRVEVNVAPEAALGVFSRVLAELAPRDRLEASFSSTPASTHALSVSPSATALEALEPSPDWLARLSLWRAARERLPQAMRDHASLRGPHLPWLAAVLDRNDLAGSYAALVRAVRRPAPQAALAFLRQALEGVLASLPEPEAAGVLSKLAADGFISEELGVPPLWLARVVLRTNCLSELPSPMWPRVLDAPSLPMLLESVQRSPRVSALAQLARTLSGMKAASSGIPGRASAIPPPAGLASACNAAMRQILDAGVSDLNLAPAVVLLLLHEHACRGEP